jgi:hypothetical protein
MDFRRLARMLLQRLAPVYIATALWGVTGYMAFLFGGLGLALVLELAWPLLRPFCEVLYEELLRQRTELQAQRRTELLKAFLPFVQAYQKVLTAYPAALLMASAPEVTTQLAALAEALRAVKISRVPESDEPFGPPATDVYDLVKTTALTLRDFRDWSLKACEVWRQQLLVVLAQGRITALRHAAQHVTHERAQPVWEVCLTEAAHALACEAEHTCRQWPWLQQAQADPAVRERLGTLLRLDAIPRQTGLRGYLATHLQRPPQEINAVMAHIRHDTVAAKVLALVEGQPGMAELGAPARLVLAPPETTPHT